MKARRRLLQALLATSTGWARAAAAAGRAATRPAVPYPQRPEVAALLDRIAEAADIDRGWLESVVGRGRYCRDAERLTTPPPRLATARADWRRYRARHVDQRRIDEGVAFRGEHAATLQQVEERFGVASDIVVAILGVETHFGRLTGGYRALDVLLTLSFDYTRRAELYRDELAEYLALCHGRGWDPCETRSSFAGALGLPQFLPSSVRRFALDFDGDGSIDLHHSVADAAGSIGNYLAAHGWVASLPVVVTVRDDSIDAEAAALASRGLVVDRSWAEMAARGIRIDGELPADADVMLVELPFRGDDGGAASTWRIGTVNFAALLQYNRSHFYAASVVELAEELREGSGRAMSRYVRHGET